MVTYRILSIEFMSVLLVQLSLDADLINWGYP